HGFRSNDSIPPAGGGASGLRKNDRFRWRPSIIMTESLARRPAALSDLGMMNRAPYHRFGGRSSKDFPLLTRKRPRGATVVAIRRKPSAGITTPSAHGTAVD
ncbi:MAG TPA: hypothetical protein VJZ91_14925, partial [Blastocatellia bacterium]|nr:hypothetical protein [Blastocatellia bacterium]